MTVNSRRETEDMEEGTERCGERGNCDWDVIYERRIFKNEESKASFSI